jgi:hypothetical protein
VNAEVLQDQTDWRGVRFGYDTSGTTGIIASSSPGVASDLAFWNYNGAAWAEQMRISGSGNVGIGTTDPGSYKLKVAGDGYFSGALSANGAQVYPGVFTATRDRAARQGLFQRPRRAMRRREGS